MRAHKTRIALAVIALCTACGGGSSPNAGGNSPPTAQASSNRQAGGTQNGSTQTSTQPNLLFWSGFEGVSVGAPYSCYASGCWQDLLGTDSASGFAWPPRIADGDGAFQARSGTASTPTTLSDYLVNEIQTVTGRTGAPTPVHSALLKQNSCTGTAGQGDCATQDVYLVRPAREPGDLYISYWRKLSPDMVQRLINTWHVVFEWKTTGDYRVIASIVTYSGTPYWQIKADNNAGGIPTFQEFWRVDNQAVSVPFGEWFKFEVFWHRSKGADGRVWMAVNGQTLVDKFGPNMGVNNNPIDRIMFMQLYSGGSYPLQQWTDDVQIWSSFPSAKPGDPWYDGVYAPH
jgi:hypothetical protein